MIVVDLTGGGFTIWVGVAHGDAPANGVCGVVGEMDLPSNFGETEAAYAASPDTMQQNTPPSSVLRPS